MSSKNTTNPPRSSPRSSPQNSEDMPPRKRHKPDDRFGGSSPSLMSREEEGEEEGKEYRPLRHLIQDIPRLSVAIHSLPYVLIVSGQLSE